MFSLTVKNPERRSTYTLEVHPLTPMRLRAQGRLRPTLAPRAWARQAYRIPIQLPGQPKLPPKPEKVFPRVSLRSGSRDTVPDMPPPEEARQEARLSGFWLWCLSWTPPVHDALLSGYRLTFDGHRDSACFVPRVHPVLYFAGPPAPKALAQPVEVSAFSGGRIVPCPSILASLTADENP